jgi:hypothetical protein
VGRYLLADVGWVSSRREKAAAAGVLDLPAPRGEIDNGFVALPAVTVVGADGKMSMFRLPICYAAVVRQFALDEDRTRYDIDVPRGLVPALPCHFAIGDRDSVYLKAEDQSSPASNLN